MSEVECFEIEVTGSNQYRHVKVPFGGSYVNYRDYEALQQKLDAVLAENAVLSRHVSASSVAVGHWNSWADAEDRLADEPEAPTTDALLNAVRAEGVDMAANFLIKADTVGSTGAMGHALHSLSLELRAETDTTSSQYESLAGGK